MLEAQVAEGRKAAKQLALLRAAQRREEEGFKVCIHMYIICMCVYCGGGMIAHPLLAGWMRTAARLTHAHAVPIHCTPDI